MWFWSKYNWSFIKRWHIDTNDDDDDDDEDYGYDKGNDEDDDDDDDNEDEDEDEDEEDDDKRACHVALQRESRLTFPPTAPTPVNYIALLPTTTFQFL